MSSQIKFVVGVQLVLLAGVSQSLAQKLIGTVEGKTYYANDYNLGMNFNWTTAKSYCEDRGLELATVTSLEQATFINSHYDSLTFRLYHWINLVEAQLPRGYSWGDTGTELENVEGIRFEPYPTRLLYGSFDVSPSSLSPRIQIWPESYKNYVLCHVIN